MYQSHREIATLKHYCLSLCLEYMGDCQIKLQIGVPNFSIFKLE